MKSAALKKSRKTRGEKTLCNMDAILEEITRLVASALHIDSVSIMTLDDQDKQLRLRSVVGQPGDVNMLQAGALEKEIRRWVQKSGEPLILRDEKELQGKNQSLISLPLRVGNELLGVINFHASPSFGDQSEEDFQKLVLFSEQIAQLIESAELILQAEKKLKGITLIEDMGLGLVSGEQDISKIMGSVISRVKNVMQASRIALLTVDYPNHSLIYEMVSGKKKSESRKLITQKGFLNLFDKPQKIITFNRTQIQKFFGNQQDYPATRAMNVSYFPIFCRKKIWGFFEIWKKDDIARFGTTELEFLNLISYLLCMGIQHQKLYEQVKQMNVKLKEKFDVVRDAVQSSTEELEGLKNFHETVLQNIGSGLLTVDCDGTITSINKSGTDILGYSREFLVGRKLSEIFGESRAEYLLFDSFIKDTPYFKKEINVFRSDGTEIPLGFTTSSMEVKGKGIIGAIILFRDLSDIKHMQAEIRRMDRLVALGELASGVAHELKNPLAVIGFSLECLRCSENKPEEKEEFLEAIGRNVQRMDIIIKKLLNMVKHQKPQFKLQQINKTIESTIMFIKKKCSQNKIEVEKDLEPGVPGILVDENQIQQVLLNLALNAIQAMKNGGILKFVSRFKEASSAHSNPEIQIEISDTGIGIPDAVKDQIFNPFFTTKSDGTGLGLAISKRIIEDHRGTIVFGSGKTGGTTFIITLPVMPEQ